MKIIKVQKDLYFDNRGYVGRLHYNTGQWLEHRVSRSTLGVIRGFHGDAYTSKLMFCLDGIIDLVIYDPKTGEKEKITMSEYDTFGVLVPPKVLNGHQCTSHQCLLYYAWSHKYTPADKQWSIYYNDETINPEWMPLLATDNLISERDKNAPRLKDCNFNE